jgi:DNA ligase (NAD+)
VTISRATLHNEDEIKRLDLKIGDTVIVGRAGDVIPDIIKVLPEMRVGNEREFKMPENCPSCGAKIVRTRNEVLWRCENGKNCLAQQREYFYHFVSKGAFDIEGLGPKIIDRLLDEGLIYDPADIFRLKEKDIFSLERFGEKSAKNIISSIQSKKNIFFKNFIYALGIRNVGEETSIDLARKFGEIDKLKNASNLDLEGILDIGQVVSKSIYVFFREKNNLKFIEKLEKVGVKIVPEKRQEFQPLKEILFVLTGTLESMSREKAKEKIIALGGRTTESISKNINYLIAGREPGSKYEKAKSMGVKIINEKEFLKMIK